MTLSNPARAALWTAVFTFVGLFGLSTLGWLQDVWEWANDSTNVVLFPDPRVLMKAAVAAAVSAIIGLVNFVVRWTQERGFLPGRTPVYVPPPKG